LYNEFRSYIIQPAGSWYHNLQQRNITHVILATMNKYLSNIFSYIGENCHLTKLHNAITSWKNNILKIKLPYSATSQDTSCTDVAPSWITEEVFMCCLVESITLMDGHGAMVYLWLVGEFRQNVWSSATLFTTNLSRSPSGLDVWNHDEKRAFIIYSMVQEQLFAK
jgi:hypothetical protein